VIENLPNQISQIAVKISPAVFGKAGMKTLLARMEVESKKVFPDQPFEYKFMSDSIAELYNQEENTAWLANASMLVTIFISCMGLFGLAMFSARRRVKEIGIRKVLGAGVGQILVLLNRDFVVLVALALVIATPIAYYLSNLWLEDFVERTGLSWWLFALAGLSAVVIALATVSFQALRAARANPVDSLRNE
jgi:ABC-type antimicrobial peptide transport system permease subunit